MDSPLTNSSAILLNHIIRNLLTESISKLAASEVGRQYPLLFRHVFPYGKPVRVITDHANRNEFVQYLT